MNESSSSFSLLLLMIGLQLLSLPLYYCHGFLFQVNANPQAHKTFCGYISLRLVETRYFGIVPDVTLNMVTWIGLYTLTVLHILDQGQNKTTQKALLKALHTLHETFHR